MKRPPEGAYIAPAREVLACRERARAALDKASYYKRNCAQAMNKVGVTKFTFNHEHRHFTATLERPWADRINVRKLYTMLGESEITLDEFFDCIEASVTAVTETLGETRVPQLLESYQKGLDLTFVES